ncbi:unnamed protein product [Arabidopsis halleri]
MICALFVNLSLRSFIYVLTRDCLLYLLDLSCVEFLQIF